MPFSSRQKMWLLRNGPSKIMIKSLLTLLLHKLNRAFLVAMQQIFQISNPNCFHLANILFKVLTPNYLTNVLYRGNTPALLFCEIPSLYI